MYLSRQVVPSVRVHSWQRLEERLRKGVQVAGGDDGLLGTVIQAVNEKAAAVCVQL